MKMIPFSKFRRFVVYVKIWISRTMSWVNMVNSGMILFLVLAKLQEYGFHISIKQWYFPLYFVVVLLMIVFGYLEDKAGFFKEEVHIGQQRNPFNHKIIEKLEHLETELEEIKKLMRQSK